MLKISLRLNHKSYICNPDEDKKALSGFVLKDISDPSKYPRVKIIQGEAFTDITGSGFYYNKVIHIPEGCSEAGIEHEYGHYLNELYFPDTYNDVPIFSFLNALFCPSTHFSFWTEIIANRLAVFYFGPESPIAKRPYIFPTHK